MSDSWIPIDKEVRSLLPKSGPYSETDALLSLSLDFNDNKQVSVAGYAKLWGWSRDKVRRFLANRRVEIVYPEDTKSKQNQRGYIKKTDQKTDNRQIKKQIELIDINELKQKSDRSKNRKPTDTQVTTSNPLNPNPKKDIVVGEKPPTKKGGNKKKFTEENIEYQLASYLFQKLLLKKPDRAKPNLNNWAHGIDYMIRTQKRNPDRIRKVIDWVFDTENWWRKKAVIQAVESLKNNFDQIEEKMPAPKNAKEKDWERFE